MQISKRNVEFNVMIRLFAQGLLAFGDSGLPFFVAGTAFRDSGLPFLVAGAAFGDSVLTFYVAGTAFDDSVLAVFVAGAAFGDSALAVFVAGAACGDSALAFFVAFQLSRIFLFGCFLFSIEVLIKKVLENGFFQLFLGFSFLAVGCFLFLI